jgi:uncharacterized protein YfaP (DUF2135 family)
VVCVGNGNGPSGTAFVINTQMGKLLWQWDLPEPTVSEPAVSPDGTVVYWATNATGNAGGHVWAVDVTGSGGKVRRSRQCCPPRACEREPL